MNFLRKTAGFTKRDGGKKLRNLARTSSNSTMALHTQLTNTMAYETWSFNAKFTSALQSSLF